MIRRQLWRGEVHTIGLITVNGPIKYGHTTERAGGGRTLGSTDFIRVLQSLTDQSKIAGLVLRIVSPGGSGLASDPHVARAAPRPRTHAGRRFNG